MSGIKPEEIADFELLKGLSEEERAPFVTFLKEKLFPMGSQIFREGDEGGDIFFLMDGKVEITKALTLPMAKSTDYDTSDKAMIRLSSEYRPVIGEVSVLGDQGKRTATVTALTDCRLGVLSAKDFRAIMDENHTIGYKVMYNMSGIVSRRLIGTNMNVLKLTTVLSLILEK
jgi:CRP/FNR family cyclic AMP-dependent transcriptional regulator